MTHSEKMQRQWENPRLRKRMLKGCVRGGEASRNLDRASQIERGIRISRALKLKRLEAHGPVR